jgi:penicillin-binding protein-related factor A (putative recombinase)
VARQRKITYFSEASVTDSLGFYTQYLPYNEKATQKWKEMEMLLREIKIKVSRGADRVAEAIRVPA